MYWKAKNKYLAHLKGQNCAISSSLNYSLLACKQGVHDNQMRGKNGFFFDKGK